MSIEWTRSAESFTFKNTTVHKGDYVELCPIEDSEQPYRLRNHSTGAEMQLSPNELSIVCQAILGDLSRISKQT